MKFPEVDWLAKWALYTPERLFLRDHRSDRSWTYDEANERACALAARLQNEAGVGRGQRVAMYATNCSEYVFLWLACVKLGAVLVPLNFRLTAPELAIMLRDSDPALLVFDPAFDAQMLDLRADGIAVPELPVASLTSVVFGGEGDPAGLTTDRPGQLDDLVMILYTSGTTG
ncbi:MAG: AMP-binding protein, partial [Candidatus Krumholzibacteria bacterium]|nr:AMP-binding protein [Candidatus Krumholzibacteria bacterium]